MTRKLLVATRNAHKVREYADMLADLQVDWLSLDDVNSELEVEETGQTFEGNAILKASAYAQETGVLTMADDSGLEVDVLNGEPGIYSARYGGPDLSFAQRYGILLEKLRNVPDERRTARFYCVIAVADVSGQIIGTAKGICAGRIAYAPAGHGGFGYDPVFLLPERGLTMAQISPEEKNKISHRARALTNIQPILQQLLRENTGVE